MKKLKKNIDFLTQNKSAKNIYGLCKYNSKKYFYKMFYDRISYLNEIKNYKKIYNKINVCDIVFYDKKQNILLFEYIENINELTLHNYLYNNEMMDENECKDISKNILKNLIITNKKINESELSNNKLFKDRLNYIDEIYKCEKMKKILNKEFNLNDKKVDMNKIINDIKVNISKSKKIYASLSQGDLTDLNVLTNGKLIDVELGGYNSIIGELSVLFNCLMINGYYFFIKYAKSAYKNEIKTYEKNKDRVDFKYDENENSINIYLKIDIPPKNKLIIRNLINELNDKLNEKIKNELNEYLKYYFQFRLMAPKKINEMNKDDEILALAMIAYFDDINNLDDIIKFIL